MRGEFPVAVNDSMKLINILCLMLAAFSASCKSWGKFWEVGGTACSAASIPQAPSFARSTVAGAINSLFLATAADCAGNIYAAGYQVNQTVSYSTGVSATGAADGLQTAVLVKYNSAGEVLWAKAALAPGTTCRFNAVTVDNDGNVYAAGYQTSTSAISYGNGITVAGNTAGDNPVLVKVNAAGITQWARSTSGGTANAYFKGVATDMLGNVFAAGYQFTTAVYGYGSGINVAGGGSSENATLVKYDAAGNALWGRSTVATSANTIFNAVTVGADYRVYAAGVQYAGTAPNYGSGAVPGACTGACSVIVRYDADGNTVWGHSVSGGGLNTATFNAIAIDATGNIYAAGSQADNTTYNYNGASVAAPLNGQDNLVLVRYDASGAGVWAQSLTAAVLGSLFASVSTDSSGNIYAAGYQAGNGTYAYGAGVSAAGASTGTNAVLVKYRASGASEWARTVTSSAASSEFKAVRLDVAGNIYAAGYQTGSGVYTYADLLSVSGAHGGGQNVIFLKFAP
jgi:hypothetical protein